MTLVDTSVWVAHLRNGVGRLRALLDDEQVLCHSFVAGELACGNLRNRDDILGLLAALPEVSIADHGEVLRFVASRRFFGRGIGWIDAHLLASSLIEGCHFWTLDGPLARVAESLGIPAKS